MVELRRVVVTGLGLLTPLGCGVKASWDNLLKGKKCATKVTNFDVSDISSKIASFIPLGDGCNGTYEPLQWATKKLIRRADPFIIYSMVTARQALEDANWKPESEEEQNRSGVVFGSGIGGLIGLDKGSVQLYTEGAKTIGPFFITGKLINLTSGHISIEHNLKGPNCSVVTACSTGAHAIIDAARMISLGEADVMVAGGSEAAICRVALTGFSAVRALSTHFNDDPEKASRPYDKDRDGFVMGEGSGALVLEDYEHAKSRGAKIYAEIKGYGTTGDAYHITAPDYQGVGAYRCMNLALQRAKMQAHEIDYINAHGTSTPLGDEIELKALSKLVTDDSGKESLKNVAISSTKSSIGHLLGAAGAVEAIFSILAIRDNIAPATLNLDNPSVDTEMNLIPNHPLKKDIRSSLSNSFGFGGTNASIIFTEVE